MTELWRAGTQCALRWQQAGARWWGALAAVSLQSYLPLDSTRMAYLRRVEKG